MKQCLKAAAAQNQAGLFWLFIHPEDLGLAASGLRPAPVWQLSEMRALTPEDGCSFALHLCTFGAASAAPIHVAGRLHAWKHLPVQWPSFDSGGSYLGPLQRCLMHNHASSVGWDGHDWRTAAGAAYPDAFSEVCCEGHCIAVVAYVLATDTLALPELPHAAESFALELLAPPEVRAQYSATLFHLLRVNRHMLALRLTRVSLSLQVHTCIQSWWRCWAPRQHQCFPSLYQGSLPIPPQRVRDLQIFIMRSALQRCYNAAS